MDKLEAEKPSYSFTEFNSLHEVPVDENPELEMPLVIDSAGQLEQVDSNVSGVDQFSPVEPTKSQISEICTELRRLRINPDPCLGVVKKYWANVPGALARVKEALAQGWCQNPTGLFINSCKSGAKGENVVTSDVSAWFERARKQRIVLAMTQGFVYTPSGEAVEISEMMRQFPLQE